VGDAMETISGDSDDAASALENMAKVTGFLIRATAYLVRGLTELYGIITFLPRKFQDAEMAAAGFFGISKDVQTSVAGTATNTAALAVSFAQTGTAAKALTTAYEDMSPNLQRIADETRDLHNQNKNLYDSETAAAQAIVDATKKIKENGKGLDVNTQKGRDNRDALSEVAGKLQDNYDNYVKVNGVGPKSAALADTLRTKFIKLAEKAGYSATEAKKLADNITGIPSSKDTKLSVEAQKALDNAREVRRALDNLHNKNIAVSVSVTGTERLNALGHRIGGYSAAGMSWAASDPSGGMARTGGPTPVNVNNSFGVYINGVMDRRSTVQVVEERSDRDAWRQKVGRRK
jgi:hypothetical protein